jgi:putative two-component system response regulator
MPLLPSRVLIVDDDSFAQDIVARWLRGAGYECVLADCAAAVWTELKRQPVDLVTLDIQMPDCSGLDLLDGIKQKFPDTVVLMVTGEGESSQAVRALTHGAFGYLCKPVERDELVAQVRSALEHRRLIIENREHLQGLETLVRQQTRVIREAHEETIHRLVTASMYRDDETGAHIRRTGLYSELLAATAGWAPELVDRIRLAAPMHDVGKIGIPDAILLKPGKLTPEEFAIMQKHAQLGAQMLSGSRSPVLCIAREIALCHHERWDGTGYPSGLKGVEIPESARIVAIVDVFDALTHDRVYRPALEPSEVLRVMRAGRGTQFDPRLFDIFWSLLPEMNAIAQTILDSDEAVNKLNLPATDLIVSFDAGAAPQWGHTCL